jgi:rod shape-determining protein MreC
MLFVGVLIFLIVLIRFSSVGQALIHTAEPFVFFNTKKIEDIRPVNTEDVRACLVEQQSQVAELSLLQAERDELRSLLHFATKTPHTYIGADIMGTTLDVLHMGVYINRGSENGIVTGQAVVGKEGVLFGVVVEVSKHRSFVRTITDPRSTFLATVDNATKSIGVIEGGFGAALGLTSIPQHEVLAVGDIVYTAALSENIPAGIIIGRIVAVEKEPYEPFQRAIIEPYADVGHVSQVLVLLR